MRTHPRSLMVAGATALALGLPAVSQAASTKEPTFTARGTLTPNTQLAGTVSFAKPSGWTLKAGGGRHTYAQYRVVEGECRLDLTASMRAKATGQSVAAQIAASVGDAPLGSGKRPGGAWGTNGPTITGGEGTTEHYSGLYGIAPIRFAPKRYGQLRIQAIVRGCETDSADALNLLEPKGTVVRQVNHILATAKTSLREVRSK